jgi:DNA-directed RNA polymerase specialized sigma24 family protein
MNALLLEAKRGNREALDELCRALQVRLRAVIQSRLWRWSRQDQEEILQDSLLLFAQKYDFIQDNPQYYALQVLHNKIGDAVRHATFVSRKVVSKVSAAEPGSAEPCDTEPVGQDDPETDYEECLDQRALLDRILAEASNMPSFCKLFIMGMLKGKTVSEVWKVVHRAEPGVSRNAFYKRIFDCRMRLRMAVGLDQ